MSTEGPLVGDDKTSSPKKAVIPRCLTSLGLQTSRNLLQVEHLILRSIKWHKLKQYTYDTKALRCLYHANVQTGVTRLALMVWAHGLQCLQAMSLISIQINPGYSLLNAQSKKLEMIFQVRKNPSKQCSEISNTLKSPSCKAMAMVWLLHDPCRVLSCLTGEHFSPQILSAWTCDSLVNGKVQYFQPEKRIYKTTPRIRRPYTTYEYLRPFDLFFNLMHHPYHPCHKYNVPFFSLFLVVFLTLRNSEKMFLLTSLIVWTQDILHPSAKLSAKHSPRCQDVAGFSSRWILCCECKYKR